VSVDPADDAPVRLDATVDGRVQGVGFRWFVLREAEELGLVGWVANTPDGSVRVVAEGPRRELERLAARLADGPTGARVSGVRIGWQPAGGRFSGFGVRAMGHPGD
jgi:acylphosphatase